MRRFKVGVIALFILTAVSLLSIAGCTKEKDVLDKEVAIFCVRDVTATEAMYQLLEDNGLLGLCWESGLLKYREEKSEYERKIALEKADRKISIELNDMTIREMLNHLAGLRDKEYYWEEYNGVVTGRPMEGRGDATYVMNRIVPSFQVQNKTMSDAIMTLIMQLKEPIAIIEHGEDETTFDISLQNVTVRQILCAISAVTGRIWIFDGTLKGVSTSTLSGRFTLLGPPIRH